MKLHTIPFFEKIKDTQNILLAGAGGGFDIYSGIPLYFSLKALGKNVTLANLSFTDLIESNSKAIFPYCYEIQSINKLLISDNYFPEKYLKEWFDDLREFPNIYAFERIGIRPLLRAYNFLIKKHNIDTVILIDGGTDSLMFGDEEGLGTPQEDIASMSAVFQSEAKNQFLVCLGFGIDHFHGVSHFDFLENVATLIKLDGYLGLFQLQKEMDEAQKFIDAVNYANQRISNRPSIVGNSIKHAIDGDFGDIRFTNRTQNNNLWINPLMSIYWCFNLKKVMEANKYYEFIKNTDSIGEINLKLSALRRNNFKIKSKQNIPL
jgi:hypothetical protein